MTVSEDPPPPPEEGGASSPEPVLDARDELDHWTLPEGFALDEDFIRSGVYEPPARTRIAIARHDADVARRLAADRAAAARPRRSDRPGRPLFPFDPSEDAERAPAEPQAPTKPRRWLRVVAGVLALSLVGSAVFGHGIATDDTAAGYAASARLTNTATTSITGISADALPGTCYGQASAPTDALVLSVIACDQPHQYELVVHQTATDFPTYPDDDYWSTYIAPACYSAAVSFLGRQQPQWPLGVRVGFFRPSVDEWAQADRLVACVAQTRPPPKVACGRAEHGQRRA